MPNVAESARIAKLLEYQVLDTPPERDFEEITAAAARLFKMPISAVSLIDSERQWFKARYGLNASQTPRDQAFCAHAIEGDDVFVVPDAHLDPKFATNPLVTGDPKIRFYAGAPLITPDNFRLGTLCVIDTAPHAALNEDQRTILTMLARLVMRELENRRIARRADHQANMMARLAEAMGAVTQAQSLTEIASLAADAARRLALADAACVILCDQSLPPEGRRVVVVRDSAAPADPPRWEDYHAPLIAAKAGVSHTAAAIGRPMPAAGAWLGFRLGLEGQEALGSLQLWRRVTSTFTEMELTVLGDLVRVVSAVAARL